MANKHSLFYVFTSAILLLLIANALHFAGASPRRARRSNNKDKEDVAPGATAQQPSKQTQQNVAPEYTEVELTVPPKLRAQPDEIKMAKEECWKSIDDFDTPTKVSCLKGMIAVYPKWPAPWINLGAILRDSGEYESAIWIFEFILKLDPNNLQSNVNLASALDAVSFDPTEENSRASALLETAISAHPTSWIPHHFKGHRLTRLFRYAEAATHFKKSVELGFIDSSIPLGTALLRAGKPAEAVAVLERWVAEKETDKAAGAGADASASSNELPAVFSSMAEARLDMGDLPGAVAALARCVEQQPHSHECRFLLGQHLLWLPGREQAALGEFRALEAMHPGRPEAKVMIARTQISLGDVDGAVATLRRGQPMWRGMFDAQETMEKHVGGGAGPEGPKSMGTSGSGVAGASAGVKGAVVCKLGKGIRFLKDLEASLPLLEQHFLGLFGYKYPVVILHEEDDADDVTNRCSGGSGARGRADGGAASRPWARRPGSSSSAGGACDASTPAPTWVETLRRAGGSMDLWFHQVKMDMPAHVDARKVPPVGQFGKGYRIMAWYLSGPFFFQLPLLEQFDYVMKMDSDSFFVAPFQYDPIQWMADRNGDYGFIGNHPEPADMVLGLWDIVSSVLTKHKVAPTPLLASHTKNGVYDGWINYANFEVMRPAFFRDNPVYRAIFDAVDAAGGCFYHRWGDGPIKSLATWAFVDPAKLVKFRDIAYFHQFLTVLPPATPTGNEEPSAATDRARFQAAASNAHEEL